MIDLRTPAIAIVASCLVLSCAGDPGQETSTRTGGVATEDPDSAATESAPATAHTHAESLLDSGEVVGTVVKAPRAVPETLRIDPATGGIIVPGGESDSARAR